MADVMAPAGTPGPLAIHAISMNFLFTRLYIPKLIFSVIRKIHVGDNDRRWSKRSRETREGRNSKKPPTWPETFSVQYLEFWRAPMRRATGSATSAPPDDVATETDAENLPLWAKGKLDYGLDVCTANRSAQFP